MVWEDGGREAPSYPIFACARSPGNLGSLNNLRFNANQKPRCRQEGNRIFTGK